MPIFISYSHSDRDFATNLAMQLVRHRANVWIDQWELHVGDSLINRVQEAIEGASCLLVVLSNASIQSQWCQKELSSGLVRELQEKRVVVLPVLIENCTIPMFLRDKLYADFRSDFDTGLRAVLEAVARVTSDSQVRTEASNGHVDWAIDWGLDELHNSFFMHFTAIEHAADQPYSVLTEIHVNADPYETERFRLLSRIDLDWVQRAGVIKLLAEAATESDLRLPVDGTKPQVESLQLHHPESGSGFQAHIRSRRLGEDTGRDVLIDIAGQLRVLHEGQRGKHRDLTEKEQSQLRKINDRLRGVTSTL